MLLGLRLVPNTLLFPSEWLANLYLCTPCQGHNHQSSLGSPGVLHLEPYAILPVSWERCNLVLWHNAMYHPANISSLIPAHVQLEAHASFHPPRVSVSNMLFSNVSLICYSSMCVVNYLCVYLWLCVFSHMYCPMALFAPWDKYMCWVFVMACIPYWNSRNVP